MRTPPQLEPLGDRILLSGAYNALTELTHPALQPSGELARLFTFPNGNDGAAPGPTDQYVAVPSIQYGIALDRDSAIPPDHESWSPEDGFDFHRLNQREVLGSIVNYLENNSEVEGASGSTQVRSVPPREMMGNSLQDRGQTASDLVGHPVALPALASTENTSYLGAGASSDGTVDLTATGLVVDAVSLGALQDNLPAPQTDLTPTADNNLTIIAAYFVGTPPANSPTEVSRGTVTDSAPTDFIVGLEHPQPAPVASRAVDDRTAAASLPAAPELPSPPIPSPTPATVDKAAEPLPDVKDISAEGQSAVEPSAEAETAGGEE